MNHSCCITESQKLCMTVLSLGSSITQHIISFFFLFTCCSLLIGLYRFDQSHWHDFYFSFLCLSLQKKKEVCMRHVVTCCCGWLGLKRQDCNTPMKVWSIITTRAAAEIQGPSLILSQLLIPSCHSATCYLGSQTVLIETWDVCPSLSESFLLLSHLFESRLLELHLKKKTVILCNVASLSG